VRKGIRRPLVLPNSSLHKLLNGLVDRISAGAITKPAYISHYGIRAQRYREMIEWYKKVFRAKIQHEKEFLAFMLDEEHHRLVMFEDMATIAKPQNAAGVDHVGYGFASLGDLVATYECLKEDGITPFLPLNHGFTTSLHCRDPDGNEGELSVENFLTKVIAMRLCGASGWRKSVRCHSATSSTLMNRSGDIERAYRQSH
jgi:catechol 2,3-dioxygenase-like lactoylglutathione lyase family enzyme